MKSLETQLGQLCEHFKVNATGKFPSSAEKEQSYDCKAITLRSGRAYQEPKQPQKDVVDVGKETVNEP